MLFTHSALFFAPIHQFIAENEVFESVTLVSNGFETVESNGCETLESNGSKSLVSNGFSIEKIFIVFLDSLASHDHLCILNAYSTRFG